MNTCSECHLPLDRLHKPDCSIGRRLDRRMTIPVDTDSVSVYYLDMRIDAIKKAISVNYNWPDRSRVIPRLETLLKEAIEDRELTTSPNTA